MEKIITFTDIKRKETVIGQIKFDGFRKMFQWTALGFDGSRLADTETMLEALTLIQGQEL